MKVMTADRSFYKTFFPLLVVISLQALAALMVNMVDNFMLGTYSELALSGATTVNQIQFILQQLVAGIGLGVVVLGSQYWGKGDVAPIRRIISVALKFGVAVGIVFCVVTLLFPSAVLGLITNDAAIVAEGVKYLRLMSVTYLIFPVSNVLMYSLQSVETAFIGTIMSLSTIAINGVLNYCLIFGNLGAPELGIVGAGIATLISRGVEFLIIAVYILRIDRKLRMKLRHLVNLDVTYFRDFIKTATPPMVCGALWGVAQGAQTAVLGHMSGTAIAANSIAVIIFQIFAVVGMSAANASSVTIGKAVGSGRTDKIREYSRTLQVIFVCLGVLSGLALFLMKERIVGMYTVSEETRRLAVKFLTVLSVTTVGTCYEYPVEGGIVAGGGDTKYAAIVDNCFMWIFTIPAAAAAAFLFRAEPVAVFWILKLDQLLKCVPNFIYCNFRQHKWVRSLTKAPPKTMEKNGQLQ